MVTILKRKKKDSNLRKSCKMVSISSIALLLMVMVLGQTKTSREGGSGYYYPNSVRHKKDSIFSSESLASDEEDVMNSIRKGELQLVDVNVEGIGKLDDVKEEEEEGKPYSAMGIFCKLDWSKHKRDPTSVPMFKDIIANSPSCKRTRVEADLYLAALEARYYDKDKNAKVRAMQPKGVVFHESRCGSTLVANSLAAFRPHANRVYSESPPPVQVFRSFDAENEEESIQLIQDTIYLMGRTTDEAEENLFFKIQSIGSKSIRAFRKAFPNTPWIYVYREPVQVMRSHMKVKDTHHAVCLRNRKNPPKDLQKLVNRLTTHGPKKNAKQLSTEEYCAAHLATLCESAERELSNSDGLGRSVNYQDLPQILVDDIIPNHFLQHEDNSILTSEEIERVTKVNSKYSKGRSNGRIWKEDSEAKEETAWDELRDASAKYLLPVYERLQDLQLKQT